MKSNFFDAESFAMNVSSELTGRLGEYVRQLRENEDYRNCDLELVLKDGTVDRLHTFVAASHSENLAKVRSGRRLDMTSYSPKCVRKVVDWMSDMEVRLPLSDLAECIIISHHLGLEELHSQLEQTVRLMAKDDDDFLLALETATKRATGISEDTAQHRVSAVRVRFQKTGTVRSRRHAQNSRSYTPSEIEDIRKLPVEFINERAISEIEQTNEQPDFRPALFSPSEIEDIRKLPVEFINERSISEMEQTNEQPDFRPASFRPSEIEDIRNLPDQFSSNEQQLNSSIDTLTGVVLDLQQKIGELMRKVDVLTEKRDINLDVEHLTVQNLVAGKVRVKEVKELNKVKQRMQCSGVGVQVFKGDFVATDLNCMVNEGATIKRDPGNQGNEYTGVTLHKFKGGNFTATNMNTVVNEGGASNGDAGRERLSRNRIFEFYKQHKEKRLEEADRLLAVLKETSGKEELGRVAYVTETTDDALAFEETSQFCAHVVILVRTEAIGSIVQQNIIIFSNCMGGAIEARGIGQILQDVARTLFDGGMLLIREDMSRQKDDARNWLTEHMKEFRYNIDGKMYGFQLKRHEVVKVPYVNQWIFSKKEFPAVKAA